MPRLADLARVRRSEDSGTSPRCPSVGIPSVVTRARYRRLRLDGWSHPVARVRRIPRPDMAQVGVVQVDWIPSPRRREGRRPAGHRREGARMLRNMKVGTKILTVLVAPLLVLGVLAGIGVNERLADAKAANDVEQFAEAAAANSALVHELQLERNLTAEFMASGGQLGGDVDTAAALDAYTQTIAALLAVNSDVAASTAVPELASAFNDYVALARA